MLKSLLISLKRRAKSYISPSVIILISFFVCFVIFHISRPLLIQRTEPKIELNSERCIMAKLEFLPPLKKMKDRDILLKELFEEIEELDGIETVTYTLNDMIGMNYSNHFDSQYSDFYTMKVASNFLDFFDIELLSGNGFTEDENYSNNDNQVIISETEANKRGSELSKENEIKLQNRDKTDFIGDIVAIHKGELNIYSPNRKGLSRDTPILFVPMKLKDSDIAFYGRLMVLFKTREHADLLSISNQIDDIIRGSRYNNMLYSSATLPLKKHRELYVSTKMLANLKLILIPFYIFLIYIYTTLLSSMINIMESRTHEIGVRRAIGHTKCQVMLFIIAEPLTVFACNTILAITIIWSLKDILNIIKPEEIIIPGVVLIFTVVLLSLIYPLIKLLNTNHIDTIQSE